jgi:hypothetical protein
MIRVTSLRFFLLAWLFPAVGHAAPASPAAAMPTLQTIIDKTLARDDANQLALQSMQYDQTADVDQLDRHDKVIRHEVLKMIISPGATPSMRIVSVTGDNVPSNPDEAAAAAKGRDVESNKNTFTLRALVSRFSIALAGKDRLAGQPAYVLAFSPKPNQPYHDETEQVVNQLQGRMWISARTYSVLRTEARLAQPVSIAWFLARVSALNFHYSTQDTDAGFAPSQVQITLQVDAIFVGFHERQTIAMTNFRSRPHTGAAGSNAPH